jgi:hypothetical protein
MDNWLQAALAEAARVTLKLLSASAEPATAADALDVRAVRSANSLQPAMNSSAHTGSTSEACVYRTTVKPLGRRIR